MCSRAWTATRSKPSFSRPCADQQSGLGERQLQLDDEALDLTCSPVPPMAMPVAPSICWKLPMIWPASPAMWPPLIAGVLEQVLVGDTRRFDKGGEYFYDQISAMHKSVRGSSPDAALYWLCRMLDGGCDPIYIARRLGAYGQRRHWQCRSTSLGVGDERLGCSGAVGQP